MAVGSGRAEESAPWEGCWESDIPLGAVRRYSRQIVVPKIGVAGQSALLRCRALVVGAGGLGSPVISYLAMAGVGTIGIADFDRVELHNLQRQSVHTEGAIGQQKTASAAAFVRGINSTIAVVEHSEAVAAGNCHSILRGYDVVVDCCDQAALRYVVNDCCRELGIDLVCASVLRWEGQVCVLPRDGPCFRCVWPRPKGSAPNCDQSGVVGPMCGVIGSMQAVEVVKVVVARAAGEVPAAKLLLYNGFSNTSHAIPIRAARCCVCTGERDENTLDAPPAVACSGVVSPDSSVPTVSWAAVLSDPSGFFLVDIRSQPHFQMFRAKGAVNIPNVEQALDTLRGTGKRVAISCYRGNSSRRAVSLLAQHGIDAVSVEGGIEELKRLLQFETLE